MDAMKALVEVAVDVVEASAIWQLAHLFMDRPMASKWNIPSL